MRVYVSVDMEGIAGWSTKTGPTRWIPDAPRSLRGRKPLTAEANAAVEVALAAGADFGPPNHSYRAGGRKAATCRSRLVSTDDRAED